MGSPGGGDAQLTAQRICKKLCTEETHGRNVNESAQVRPMSDPLQRLLPPHPGPLMRLIATLLLLFTSASTALAQSGPAPVPSQNFPAGDTAEVYRAALDLLSIDGDE